MLQLCMQTVVAALLWRGSRILIAQRAAGEPHPLEWEFPGGKVEPGESPEAALKRELQEELGIEAVIGPEYTRYEFAYPLKSPLSLRFFTVTAFDCEPQTRGMFQQLVWEDPERLSGYEFLAGDLPLIQLLRKIHVD